MFVTVPEDLTVRVSRLNFGDLLDDLPEADVLVVLVNLQVYFLLHMNSLIPLY